MSGNIMQDAYQFPTSPGKSSGDENSASAVYGIEGPSANHNVKQDSGSNNVFTFENGEADKYMRTPRNGDVQTVAPTAATLSPQSQSPPQTPPQSRKTSAITPVLQRGRELRDDEIAGGGSGADNQRYPSNYVRTSNRDFGTPSANINTSSYRGYQPDDTASPNTTIHNNRIMTQQLQQQVRNIDMSGSLSDSPDSNHMGSVLGGNTSNHDRSEATSLPMSMLWGNDLGGVRHPGEKPKRPLSAYNFYFQLERGRIINSAEEDRDADVTYTLDDVAQLTLIQQRKAKENKPKEKRSHRKTHGKISFGDLARTIANKWKKLDKSAKEIFEGSAAIEKERYRKELGEWNKQMKKWKDAASKVASTLHYSQSGGLTTGSNHSQQGLNTSTHMSYNNVNHLVTPDLPKRAVYQNADMVEGPDDYTSDNRMIHAIANQHRTGNANGAIGSLSNHSNSSSVHQQNSNNRVAAFNGVLQQSGIGMLPSTSGLGNRLNGLRQSIMPQSNFNGLGRNNGVGLGLFDYGDDIAHPYGLNDAGVGDDEYYVNDGLPHIGNGNNMNNNYDYDDITDETYRMAQMMLPPQNSLAQRNGNGHASASLQQQQRRAFNQRRMKMLMMMQQKYKRDQMLMMQMGQYNGNGMDGEHYDQGMDEPQQQYLDQLDDAASYIDTSATANHLMLNQSTAAAAAAAAFGRSQQQRHFLQQRQSRLVDELGASHHSAGMDDQYHSVAHLLHADNYDDRA